MDWMRRAVRQMMRLTAYYRSMDQPLKDEAYEHIVHTFADYTKKSRNNALIIECSVAFMVYLDGVERGAPVLDKYQMEQIEAAVDRMFAILPQQEARGKMSGTEEVIEGELLQELQEVFQEYASECSRQSEVRENSKRNELETSRQSDGKLEHMGRVR